MWWNMLVARFFKHVFSFVTCIAIVITNCSNWLMCNRQSRWKLRNACPGTWMILSALMLDDHFVNIIAAAHLHQTLTPSARNSVSSDPCMWFPLPPPEPPDNLKHICTFQLCGDADTNDSDQQPTHTVHNANVVHATSQTQ